MRRVSEPRHLCVGCAERDVWCNDGSGTRIPFECRHEWNVGAADVDTQLKEQGRDLAAVVGLMVEHVSNEYPFRDGANLAVDLAGVGERFREPLRRETLGPRQQASIEALALGTKVRKAVEKIDPRLGHYRRHTAEPRQEREISIGDVVQRQVDRLEESAAIR